MKLRPAKAVLCLAFAAVAAGAWGLHMLGHAHGADEDCRVCAIASVPELNADCGTTLLVRPDRLVTTAAALPGRPLKTRFAAAFLGRAPPAA